jgi:vacuolar-type H+-ATPase subunit H
MLTELEQRANDEARHAHRELVEKLEAELRSMALDYLVAVGQAAEAYQAQLAAEAERDEALNQLDSARHSVDVLLRRVAELKGETDGETPTAVD